MKKLILLTLLICHNAFSQDLKIYDGEYEDSYGGSGNGHAIYQYFENENYERIYHGNFSYESKLYTNDRNSRTVIQGRFENNNKVGDWVYNREYKKLGDQTTIKGKYKKGLKDGQWSFYQKGYNENSANGITYYLTFKNDSLIGEVNIDGLKGNFDQKGGYTGKWVYNTGSSEKIVEFDDNLLLKLIDRKTSTGEIYSRFLPVIENKNIQKESSRTLYTKESISKVIFAEVFGISEDKVVYGNQVNSIQTFLKGVKDKIYSLQENWNKFLLLDYFIIGTPDVLVLQKLPKKDNIEEITTKPHNKKLNYFEEIGLDGDKNYKLGGRRALIKTKYVQDCNESGLIVVTVEVDQDGRVLNATLGTEGTTSNKDCLMEPAKRAALSTIFNPDKNAPQKQIGTITYSFKLSN